ncbi:nuclear distribution protein PAC1 [Striga asiatica]|uniref:Nuclear distribution protein PAC1 n=1 Tax=Striga asiatica TaxID=4170 RepID=A0A5A7QVT6_STRAF|nr:nuclear distribution protein PAC1 [Striga asiatica]
MGALSRALTSNAAINTALTAALGFLMVRSVVQERSIQALEAHNGVLLEENKLMKDTRWDWKQKLYAEAEENPQNAPVLISTLKSLYGEAVAAPTSDALVGRDDKQDGKVPAPKIMT